MTDPVPVTTNLKTGASEAKITVDGKEITISKDDKQKITIIDVVANDGTITVGTERNNLTGFGINTPSGKPSKMFSGTVAAPESVKQVNQLIKDAFDDGFVTVEEAKTIANAAKLIGSTVADSKITRVEAQQITSALIQDKSVARH